MFKWSSSVALALALTLGGAALAQMASKNQKVDVLRVGSRLACQCGGCSDTVATCSMYGCWSHTAKEKIAKMQEEGKPDDFIVASFVKDGGLSVLAEPPQSGFNLVGWLMPFIAITLGVGAILFYVKKYRPQSATADLPEIDQTVLNRYRERIDKDLAKLD